MTAAKKLNLISVEEYLAGELASPVKHEYLGGIVYAMAGARNAHNIIADNISGELRHRLRGKPCRSFNSNTKVRIKLPGQIRFYYPDSLVTCRPNPQHESFQNEPVVVAEVLSKSTRRIDEGEKKDAYLTIPTLRVYMLVEQSRPEIVVYRLGVDGFAAERHEGIEAIIPLPELGVELPLTEVYDGVEFEAEADEE